MNRLQYISVLLTIALSHAAVGIHSAAHNWADSSPVDPGQTELAECELCSAYSDPSDAIPATNSAPPSVETYLDPFRYNVPVEALSALIGVQPRGPPLAI